MKAGIRTAVPCTLTVGKTYRISYTITATGVATVASFFADSFLSGLQTIQISAPLVSGTRYSNIVTLTAAGAVNFMLVFTTTGASSTTVSGFTAQEIAGNHASQATSTSRPVLSARVNLLTYSEQFDNAAWTKTGLTASASLLTATAATSAKNVQQSGTIANVANTFSVNAKAGTLGYLQIANGAGATLYANFDLLTGSLGTIGAGASSATISPLGGGWYRCSVTCTPSTNSNFRISLISSSTAAFLESWTSVGTETLSVTAADLRVTNDGVGIPAYQRINAATDYDTSGFPLYLAFDGVDDSLSTASVDFSATNKMSVFAGVRKLSDTAQAIIAELSDNAATNNGVFTLLGPSFGGGTNFGSYSKGTTLAATSNGGGASPDTAVLTAIGNISAPSITMRVDAVQTENVTTTQGTGNYGNYPLYIGRRGGASLPFNGRIYSLIVRGATTTADQIARTEAWVNNITKAY